MTSTAGAENNDGWNTKAKESSCSLGSKSENAASGSSVTKKKLYTYTRLLMYMLQAYLLCSCLGEERQGDPWSSKIDCTAKGA